MVLNAVLGRFIEQSPITVMAQLALQQALEESWVGELFERHRQRQYTRELLFSTTVDLMSLVALGLRPSVHAAAQAQKELSVSLAALYDKILSGWHERQAAFIVREHGHSPTPTVCGRMRKLGRIETGVVYEQAVQVALPDGAILSMRRIEIRLDAPTEDGATVIRLLTNLPSRVRATKIALLYRQRWKIEGMFQRLESVLHSEVHSLGYPRAALFAFGIAWRSSYADILGDNQVDLRELL
jgi:hypothetical protein